MTKRTAAGAAPREFHPPARFSCSPTHRLRRFERSDCGCKVVSLCVLRVVACKLPHLLYGAVFVARHILSDIRHGVPAAQLGAKGTYPICPMLRRRYLAPLSLSRFRMALLPRQQRNGKGGERKRPAADAVYSSALKVWTAIISFACSRSRMSWSTPK